MPPKPIEIDVVDDAALRVRQQGILGLVQVQGQDVAGEYVLQIGDGLGAFDVEAAHVGHVKDAAHAAAVEVLGNDAGGILDRHVPAAEIHHRGAGSDMRIIEYGTLQIAHFLSFPPYDCDVHGSAGSIKRRNAPCGALRLVT